MVGEILRKRREELGRDLREIADNLKIRYDYLKALEDGGIEKLPAEVYIKGYIREYAKILNMDPEPLIAAYARHPSSSTEGGNSPPELVGFQKKQSKAGRVLILLVLVAVVIIASVQLLGTQKKSVPSTPVVETKKETMPKTANSELVLQVLASDTTWLFVTIDKADSKEVLMKPGDSITCYAKKGFFLKIGNAGGVRLVFNGKEVGKLGEKGQVIKINLPDSGI